MNRVRLERLVQQLANVPADAFDMRRWTDSGAECGFAGCAVGWATQDPISASEGLHLAMGFLKGLQPVFGDETGWSAVEAFYELDEADAMSLFNPSYYAQGYRPTTAQVAAKIRAFMHNREPHHEHASPGNTGGSPADAGE